MICIICGKMRPKTDNGICLKCEYRLEHGIKHYKKYPLDIYDNKYSGQKRYDW